MPVSDVVIATTEPLGGCVWRAGRWAGGFRQLLSAKWFSFTVRRSCSAVTQPVVQRGQTARDTPINNVAEFINRFLCVFLSSQCQKRISKSSGSPSSKWCTINCCASEYIRFVCRVGKEGIVPAAHRMIDGWGGAGS